MKDELMSCKNNYVHEDKVQIAEHNMPSEENLISVTELFKVLGDPTRTKILSVLYNDELCVCDKTLRMARLIKSRRSGKEIYYSLADDHVGKIYHMAIEHVME